MNRALRISIAVLAISATACGGGVPGVPGENACGTGPLEANGNPDRATSHALGSQIEACMGAGAEVHFYKITAPDDITGGYVQGSVTGAGVQSVRVTAYAASGTTELARFVSETPGAAATFFVAVAPRQDFQLAIANNGAFTEPYTFNLTTSYTPVPDGFEPNDTLEAATPVTVNASLQAYLFGAADNAAPYDDYYRFAAGGSVTIRIEDVAPDLAPRLTLYTADGMEAARVASGLKGSPLVMQSPTSLAPGDLVVRVAPWSTIPQSTGPGPLLPEHFTRPYRLSVTEP